MKTEERVFDPTTDLKLSMDWHCYLALPDGKRYESFYGLRVIMSGAIEQDGKKWIHVSLSRKSRMPTYKDITVVKRLFIGADKKALQVLEPESEHANIHPFCLHLWHCVDADPLPDFTHGLGTI